MGIRDSGLGIGDHEDKTQDRAAWLCGKTDKGDRAQILKDFREGKIQFVVNVGVLTEGFDDAGVEVVVMARPTKSRALYAQMAGRATRPSAKIASLLGKGPSEECKVKNAEWRRKLIADSDKPSCLIIDFVGNSGRHKLVTTADILGGKDLDEDAEIAAEVKRRCTGSAEGLDMLAAASVGLNAVGRSACLTGAVLLRDFIKRHHVRRVTIIADDDPPKARPGGGTWRPGIDGAKKLAADLGIAARIVLPFPGFKDIREWYAKGGLTKEKFETAAKTANWSIL